MSEQIHVVAQATTIVAAQFGIDSQAALNKIVQAASDRDRTLYELASEIVERNEM